VNIDMIREGGIGAYAAILLGLLGVVLGAVAIVAMLGKSRSAFSLGVATLVVSTATAGAGMLGTVYGRYQVKRALAFVSSQLDVERILRQGFREAQQSSWVGLFAALIPLALGAAAAFAGSRLQQPRTRMQGFAEPVVSSDDGVGGQSMIALIFIGIAALASGGAYAMANTELPKLRYAIPDDDHEGWSLAAALEDLKNDQNTRGCERLAEALEPYWGAANRKEWPRTMRPISPELAWRGAADGCAKKIVDSFDGEPLDPPWRPDDLLDSPLLQDDALHARVLAWQPKTPEEAPLPAQDEGPQGSLSKDEIRRTIMRELKAITACYERELVKQPSLGGKVVVSFTIGSDGKVSSAEEASEEAFPSAKVTACIVARFKSLQFPKPAGGGVVKVKYPLVFKSAE
jgi:hypothetical protein